MANDDVVTLLRDEDFLALVGGHLAEGQPGEGQTGNDQTGNDQGGRLRSRYEGYVAQLTSNRFVVPIAGVQGSGKSTALNAIAFDRRVLPVDVDETTCVPVEIGWSPESAGSTPAGNAVVRYADGREEIVPATEEALQAAVHNNDNPGNAKGVERVVLQSDSPLFRNGLVLVDLPGTGSLTASNLATTERYLAEAVGVIFMLRTVPPLTRSESVFIAQQWARLRTAYFFQNRWSDETEEEAEAGREHNAAVLRELAGRNRIPLDGDPRIHLVDADAALYARFAADEEQLAESGLSAFVAALETESRDWRRRVRQSVLAAVATDCVRVRTGIAERLEALRADDATRRKTMEEEGRRFDRYIGAIDARVEEVGNSCRAFRSDMIRELEWWEKKRKGELRNAMRTKLRAGITDGPRLERALRDEQGLAAEDAFEMVQTAIMRLRDEVEHTLEGLGAWEGRKPDAFFTVSREESTKWENLIPVILSPLGGVAGAWAGGVAGGAAGVWASAQAGALLGAALGPVGAVLGLLGGIAGGVLGGLTSLWIGQKSRDLVVGERAKAVEDVVFAAIDRFFDTTRKSLVASVCGYCHDIETALSDWRLAQVCGFEEQRRRAEEVKRFSGQEKDALIAGLLGDLEKIGGYAEKISEAAHDH